MIVFFFFFFYLFISLFILVVREVTNLSSLKKEERKERNKQLGFNDSVRPNYKTSATYFDLCVSMPWVYSKTLDPASTHFGFVYIYLLNV